MTHHLIISSIHLIIRDISLPSGGRVDFYLSGDSSIIFNNDYESANFFIASNNDVCTPSDVSIVYEKSSIIPSFPTHHSIIPMRLWNSPSAAPTNAIITTTIKVPYEVSSKRTDSFIFKVCDPGLYTFGDCDCAGDTFMSIYAYFDGSAYYDYSNDGCEGPSKCSKITYTYTGSTCKEFYFYVESYDGKYLNGNVKLVGSNITDVLPYYSQIMCIGDISNACQLTCPDSTQDIYIDFASWGNRTRSVNYRDSGGTCEDNIASYDFYNMADNDCRNQHSCTISPTPALITTTCNNSKLYISAICFSSSRRRLEMEQATLKETVDDIDQMIQISKINRFHSAEKLVPSEAEIILNRRLAEVTLSQRAEETRKHRRTEDRIPNRRNLVDSRPDSTFMKQPCYNDIDDEYVLKIEGYVLVNDYDDDYSQYTSYENGEMFKDDGNSYSIYIYKSKITTNY